jgi:fluoroacetyl-CoA thioesterase
MSFEAIRPGLRGEVQITVADSDTAQHLGSGAVKVLATPQMVLLIERAGVAAVDHLLPEGYRSVGTHLDIQHLAPTPIGFQVRASAELVEVNGRRLTFRAKVHEGPFHSADSGGVLVGEGTHQRAIVNLQRFGERVAEKSGLAAESPGASEPGRPRD